MAKKKINSRMDELSVIIPAYNEEEGIIATISQIRKYAPGARIIVVDDASQDKTFKLAKKQGVTVIKHSSNKGYGGAIKTGIMAAKTKYIAFTDADLTYHPKYLRPFLADLKKKDLDFVWGNRFGGSFNKMPGIRKFGNRILMAAFFLFTGKTGIDSACGLRVFTKEGVKKIEYTTLSNGLDMTPAMSKRVVARKLRFGIIGMDYSSRQGASKLNVVKDFMRMMRNIILEK